MANLFDGFKDLLVHAISDEDFVRKNTMLQDTDYLADMTARIRALTADVSLKLTYTDVISTLGMASKDPTNRVVRFNPKGFETTLSAFREGGTSTPRRFWSRPDATDSARYLLSDGGAGALTSNGVLALTSDLEVLYRFPGFGSDLAGGEYEDSADAVTFTVGALEYIAIACTEHACVQIYLFDDPYTCVGIVGVIDTPGVDATGLTAPWSLAVDEDNAILYVACETGQPATATAVNGFVSAWDISVPATPVYSSTPFLYKNTGSLLDREVHTPNDIFFDGTYLWVANGNNSTVGAFDLSGTVPICRKYIESSGNGYTLRTPQQISVQEDIGGFKSLFVVNQETGTVEEFNYTNMTHVESYGIRSSEDDLGTSYDRLTPDVYGALGSPQGVIADKVNIDDQDTNVIVVSDILNKRLHRFNKDAYSTDNFVNFAELEFDVPLVVNGWTTNGNFPIDLTTVQYRFQPSEEWQQLPQETSLPPSSTIQLRLSMQLDTRRFIRQDWYVRHLRINGEQA